MTDKAELLALALRCEQATGPDRDIDRAIKNIVGDDWDYSANWDRWDAIKGEKVSEPVAKPYTASLDSAMTLVPEGWGFSVRRLCDGRSSATAYAPCTGNGLFHAATPALALTAAALRALASEQPA